MLTLDFSALMFQGEDMFHMMFDVGNHMKVSSIVIPQKNVIYLGPLIVLDFLLSQEFNQVITSSF